MFSEEEFQSVSHLLKSSCVSFNGTNMPFPCVKMRLLGEFKLSFDNGPPITVRIKRLQALFVYLAIHYDEPPTRQHLAVLFWPDSRESQARTNLRQLLHNLRQDFPHIDNYLHIGKKQLTWQRGTHLYCDAKEFEKHLIKAKEAESAHDMFAEITQLETALKLYKADLFPGCYDEWIEGERFRLQQLFSQSLTHLTQVLEKKGMYENALGYAERLLSHDRFNEKNYRQVMKLYALVGDRTGVVCCYNRCVQVLDNELDIEPDTETQEVYNRLQRKRKIAYHDAEKKEIPLVGRQNEWQAVLDSWQKTQKGCTQFLLLSGEAGIGKTRLAQNLLTYLNRQGFSTATAGCYGVEGQLAYSPVAEWLKSDSIFKTLHDLKDVWQSEISRLLPELLEQDASLASSGPLGMSWQRQRFFKALAHAVVSCRQPLLLFVDDLQWCDSETLEWMHYLLRYEPAARILLMGTVRSEDIGANNSFISFILELRRSGVLTEIELGALDARQTAELGGHIAGQDLNAEAAASLFEESEGSPLFIVEMTRAELEGAGDTSTFKMVSNGFLPKRVQAVIQMRLSNLTPVVVALLEMAAIIGRNFTFEVIVQASNISKETIIESLEELCSRGLVREQKSTYDFSHDKIREVILSGMSAAKSQLFHLRIAEAFETVFSGQLDHQSARLAFHYENAGLPLKAISYYIRAGKLAKQIYANTEAEEYLHRALHLASKYLEGTESERCELEILRDLSTCLVQGRGYGAQEVRKAGLRVIELCKQHGEQPDPPLLRMLAISKLVAGKIFQAEKFGLQLLKQSKTVDNNVVRVEAHYVLGVTYYWQGRFSLAREHLEKATMYYDPQHHQTHIVAYAQNPAVICSIRLALVLWHLGHFSQSQRANEHALDMAKEIKHPFSRAYAMHWSAWLHNLRGDIQATLHQAEASIAFAEDYNFRYFSTQSSILHGWALSKTGKIEEGLQKMREGLSSFRATGSEVGCSYYRALIAEALAANGQIEQSRTLLDDTVRSLANTGERWSQQIIMRIQKEVLAIHSIE